MENSNTENGNTENIKWIVKGLNIHCYNCNDTVCFYKGYCWAGASKSEQN